MVIKKSMSENKPTQGRARTNMDTKLFLAQILGLISNKQFSSEILKFSSLSSCVILFNFKSIIFYYFYFCFCLRAATLIIIY